MPTQHLIDDRGEHITDVTYRPEARGAFPLLAEMYVERGSHADWDLLSSLHYKMDSLPVGAKFWRLALAGETIGVCVIGRSKPLLKERHAVFPNFRPGNDSQASNIHRYRIVNDWFRTISRFVIDTMFRSAGCAYRFVNLVSRMHCELQDDGKTPAERKKLGARKMIGLRYLEIQSSMSKYNSFAQRAGFSMVKPIRSIYYDKGLNFMRRWFAAHPADQEAIREEFQAMSPALQRRVEREMKEFYYGHSPLEKTGSRRHYSEGVVDNWPIETAIAKIQGLCFASPLYGFYRNPEVDEKGVHRLAGITRLPLLAFDLQSPSEPLRLDGLDAVPGWQGIQRHILLDGANGAKESVAAGAEHAADEQREDELMITPSVTGEGTEGAAPEQAAEKKHRRTRAEHLSPRSPD